MKSLPPCTPPFWALGPHRQTLFPYFFSGGPKTGPGDRFEIPLPDGDRLQAEYFAGTRPWVVVAFHGLTGSTQSRYMGETAAAAGALGLHCVLTNHRGCGDGLTLARGPYHSGRAEDIAEVLKAVEGRHPRLSQIAVGFSLSGNALLLGLAGERAVLRPHAALAVNAPIDLRACAVALTQGWNRLYGRHFVDRCRKNLADRQRLGLVQETYPFPRRMTLMDFDDLYTAPAGGFRNRDDYYDQCSAGPRAGAISVPTTVVTAADDPFVPVEAYHRAPWSPSVRLRVEAHGGHLGYLSRGPHRNWLGQMLQSYLTEVCGPNTTTP